MQCPSRYVLLSFLLGCQEKRKNCHHRITASGESQSKLPLTMHGRGGVGVHKPLTPTHLRSFFLPSLTPGSSLAARLRSP